MHYIFLQATTPQASSGGGSLWSMPLMMLMIFGVMYFFMVRPQQQRQKKEDEFRNAMKVGDKIMTSSGIYGTVSMIEDKTVLVEVDKGTKIRFSKAAIVPLDTTEPETK